MNLYRHLILVFTHVNSRTELNDLLSLAPQPMKDLKTKCNDRVLGIENGTKKIKDDSDSDDDDEEEEDKKKNRPFRTKKCNKQVDAIVKSALELREKNRHV